MIPVLALDGPRNLLLRRRLNLASKGRRLASKRWREGSGFPGAQWGLTADPLLLTARCSVQLQGNCRGARGRSMPTRSSNSSSRILCTGRRCAASGPREGECRLAIAEAQRRMLGTAHGLPHIGRQRPGRGRTFRLAEQRTEPRRCRAHGSARRRRGGRAAADKDIHIVRIRVRRRPWNLAMRGWHGHLPRTDQWLLALLASTLRCRQQKLIARRR